MITRQQSAKFGNAAPVPRFEVSLETMLKTYITSLLQALQARLECLSVRASLRLAFMSLLAGSLAIGIFSLAQMRRINGSTHTLYETEYKAAQAAEAARSDILRASRAQKMLLTATTAKERETLGAEIETNLKSVNHEMATIRKLSSGAESIDLHQRLSDSMAAWSKRLRAFVKLVGEQPLDLQQMDWQVGTEDATLLLETGKLEKSVNELVAQRGASAKSTIAGAGRIFDTSVVMVAAMTLLLMLSAYVIGAWVMRRLMRQLGGEPSYAMEIASRIAQGDLNVAIAVSESGRASILDALQQMQRGLARTVSDIASSAEAVANASADIATGNADLSHRTEEQSTSLENTASSMAHITEAVRHNADSAQQAAALADSASAIAQEGGAVVSRVVGTMAQISQSAKSIHDIIGVIEGIAFQTNILALNAAVEAAHAGDQGRGFAVVAAEVRNLAQRSAIAAKDIKTLVDSSVQRVASGAQLAQLAGQTMTDVVQAVRSVTEKIAEISLASRDQSSGIAQINQAMSQLDQGTQQNAALVEQAGAAAQSLDEQAKALRNLVSRFELPS